MTGGGWEYYKWGLIACWTMCGVLSVGNIVCWITVFRSKFFVKSNGHEIGIGGTDESKKIIEELKKQNAEFKQENLEFRKENLEFKQEISDLKKLLWKYLDGKKDGKKD